MAVKPLLRPKVENIISEQKIEDFIGKGSDSPEPKPKKTNILMRMPTWIIKYVDKQRKKTSYHVSRQSYIIKMLEESIENNKSIQETDNQNL